MKERKTNPPILIQACAKWFMGVLLAGAALFLPAGTLNFWKAWLLMAVLFLPMLPVGIVLWIKAPALLARRLQGMETRPEQRRIVLLSFLMFACGFVVAGLDFRYGWSRLPGWVSVAFAIVFLFSYGLYAEVLRENAYASRTIEVQAGQKLMDTGLYGQIRHPMYLASVLLFLSIPLICGSVCAFVVFLLYPPLIVRRIQHEEAVLKSELAGYEEYMRRVRFRLLPFLW